MRMAQGWIVLAIGEKGKKNADSATCGHVEWVVSVVLESGDGNEHGNERGNKYGQKINQAPVGMTALVKDMQLAGEEEGEISEAGEAHYGGKKMNGE